MNRAKRYVARQILHSLGVMLCTIYHELWRVVNIEADGLQPSEWRQAERLLRELYDFNNRLSDLSNRIKTGEPPS